MSIVVRCRRSALLSTLALLLPVAAQASDSCDPAAVIQPAIDQAAQSQSCNADGVYISPSQIAESLVSKCSAAKNLAKCKACVEELRSHDMDVARGLQKLGLFDRSDVSATKSALDGVSRTACASFPTPTPTPSPTPSGHDGSSHVELGALLQSSCPCNGTFTSHDSYMQCASGLLSSLVSQNKILQSLADSALVELRKSSCGAPPHPSPSPTPSASPTPHSGDNH